LSLIPHDLYVIGTQESALSEKEWTAKVRSAIMDFFGIEMHTVRFTSLFFVHRRCILLQVLCVSLWAMRILVLVKPEYKHKITHVQHSSVKTGIANTLGIMHALCCAVVDNDVFCCRQQRSGWRLIRLQPDVFLLHQCSSHLRTREEPSVRVFYCL
jgi:phosphatidylinositol-3,4,5-trisphosphate 5-phosphatase 2